MGASSHDFTVSKDGKVPPMLTIPKRLGHKKGKKQIQQQSFKQTKITIELEVHWSIDYINKT